jgi:hypothetical protein
VAGSEICKSRRLDLFRSSQKRFSLRTQLGDRDMESASTSLITDDDHDEDILLGSQVCGLSIRTSDSISIGIRTA